MPLFKQSGLELARHISIGVSQKLPVVNGVHSQEYPRGDNGLGRHVPPLTQALGSVKHGLDILFTRLQMGPVKIGGQMHRMVLVIKS